MLKQRIVIEVGDMAVSNSVQVILSTYALGSCIGVIAYDPLYKVGGVLHLMLPDSTLSPDKASAQPAMFADTGLPRFFKMMVGLKASMDRVKVFVAGGASVVDGLDSFKIGERNIRATQQFFERNNIRVSRADTGGGHNRSIHLDIQTGAISMKTPASDSQFSLAA